MDRFEIKLFKWKDEWYIRTIPSKKLFNSTMVHEVVNRGDIFAVRLSDQALTIIPGKETDVVWMSCLVDLQGGLTK